MNMLISLKSELLKTKRTASYYLTLIGAAAGPIIYLCNVLMDEDELQGISADPLNGLFKVLSGMNSAALFPLFIILICTLLPQVEFRNNTWKQVFTSPQSKASVFFAKFLNVQLLMLIFLVATHIFMFLIISLINLIKPQLEIFSYSFNGNMIVMNAVYAYITVQAMVAIEFWMGMRSKNFIVPIGVGIILWLVGTIIGLQHKTNLVDFFPYSFQAYLVSPTLKPLLNQVAWTSVIYTILFLAAGYFDFKRKALIK